jgi:hypothetical protein
MSKVQGPDEGDQMTHLPPAAEVEMPEMRQSQDAESCSSLTAALCTHRQRDTSGGEGLALPGG